jgi:glutamate-1-semialdehyde aminotransferase
MTHASDVPEASSCLAGGVSASLRLHPYLGHAFNLSRGEGPYIYDEQGNRDTDLNTSNGVAILSHAHPEHTDISLVHDADVLGNTLESIDSVAAVSQAGKGRVHEWYESELQYRRC